MLKPVAFALSQNVIDINRCPNESPEELSILFTSVPFNFFNKTV
jgi:hypothetical protein